MTTDFGHTPGPWMVSKRASRRVTSDTGIVICNAVLRNSGSAKRGIRHGAKETLEAEANARLIAASECMLSALIGLAPILATAESNASGNPEWESVSAKINAARAAIAKATGQ